MLPAEKAFMRLMSELASDGLFNGPERDGVWERIVEAFEAAMEEAKASAAIGTAVPPPGTPTLLRADMSSQMGRCGGANRSASEPQPNSADPHP